MIQSNYFAIFLFFLYIRTLSLLGVRLSFRVPPILFPLLAHVAI